MTHDSDDKQCRCAHQICPGHFSVGQTLRTDENVVLLFADTHLKQNENIKFPSLKKSLLLWKMYMHSIQQQCFPMFLSVLVKKKKAKGIVAAEGKKYLWICTEKVSDFLRKCIHRRVFLFTMTNSKIRVWVDANKLPRLCLWGTPSFRCRHHRCSTQM